MSETQWGPAWTATIGLQVRALRQEAGLSVQKLVDKCAEMDFPIPRGTVANMELGTRPNVTVQEVAVLAAALGVPPVRLLYPIRDGASPVEPIPGVTAYPVEAAEWFSGLGQLGGEVASEAADLALARRDAELQRDADRWRTLAEIATADVARIAAGLKPMLNWTPEDVERFTAALQEAAEAIRLHRREMVARGVTPGPVLAGLESALSQVNDDA